MRSTCSYILAILCAAALGLAAHPVPQAAPLSPPVAQEPISLTFGVYRTDKATTMYRTFLPIIEALQEALSERLGCSVDIELKIYKTYDDGLDSLVKGEVDFVRFGPASYVLAKRRNPDIDLLAMEHKGGKKRFLGVFAVKADDPATRLSDLKGRRFAFGDENSTIGRYLAQAELVRNGVHEEDLAFMAYLGRHDAVAKAVQLGDFDAGSLKISTFEKMNKDGQLRALATFENVTKPWIARAGLDTATSIALRELLLGFEDPEPLAPLKISGWLPTSDQEYAFVRDGMELAENRFTRKQGQ